MAAPGMPYVPPNAPGRIYSRQEAQIDYSDANEHIAGDARNTLVRLDAMASVVSDENLELAKIKLQDADSKLSNAVEVTVEEAKQILLEWAQNQFPAGEFNSVGHETYSYSKTFTFTKEEPTDAAQ